MNHLRIIAVLLVAAVGAYVLTARADVVRSQVGVTAATTNVWTDAVSLPDRGILRKTQIILDGTAKTGDVWLADSDGSLIYSNTLGSGTTTITTNLPVVGVVVKTMNATTNALTVRILNTLEK